MVGILILSHGRLAEGLISSVQSIIGDLEQVKGVSIWPKDSGEEVKDRIQKSMIEVNDRSGVVILTDILGGTPTNLTLSFSSISRGLKSRLTSEALKLQFQVSLTAGPQRPGFESERRENGKENLKPSGLEDHEHRCLYVSSAHFLDLGCYCDKRSILRRGGPKIQGPGGGT